MNTQTVFYPLSESQKSIWHLEKAYPGTSLNVIAGNLRFKGEVSYRALEEALHLLVKKNDSMRLRVHETHGTAMQYVAEYRDFQLDFFDFSKSGGLKDLFLWDEGKTKTPFNLIDSDLLYCALYKIGDAEGGVYMKMHRLISDAWTLGLATRQLIDAYARLKDGLPVSESPNPSFLKHLHDDTEYEASKRFENDRNYWLGKFGQLPKLTVLKPRASIPGSISAKRKTLITPLKLTDMIRQFCAANNLSVFTLFLSALSIYINRVTEIEDIVLGTTTLNRTNIGDKETTGLFASIAAPVRIAVHDAMDFRTFAKTMMKESTDVLRHQKYPFNYLAEDLKKHHSAFDRLFDIVLTYQNSKKHINATDTEYLTKWIFSSCQVESLIISINDREDGGNLFIDYDFLTDMFDIREIEFIHQHIINLLWHALDNPTKRISKLEMISEKEKRTILRDFNHTYADYPTEKTINRMFEQQADRTPDHIAVSFNGRQMTYAELNTKSNMLARTLRNKGVGPDKIVGIMAYRSFEQIIGIMAVLKAGGAYLPLCPDDPLEHNRYKLENSRAEIILVQHDLRDQIEYGGQIINIDEVASYIGDGRNLPALNSSGDLAYIFYTPVSAGEHKGVMFEHTGVVNSFCWGVQKFCLNDDSIVLQKTPFTDSPSVREIFWWLMLGGKVCLMENGREEDHEAVVTAIAANSVTALHVSSDELDEILAHFGSASTKGALTTLRQVFSCGAAISAAQAEHFNNLLYVSNGTELYSLYGHSEAAAEAACFDCSPSELLASVPIGKRIDNFSVYILDKNRNLMPVGIPGELYISGAGLGRGYINNPELTTARFLVNPFIHGEKMFRTGERARWYPQGDIELLGKA